MSTLQIQYNQFEQAHWSEQEQENVKVAIEFIQLLMNDHNFELLQKKYGDSVYLQHNRNITNGFDAIIDYVGSLTKRFPDYSYDVKHIFVDGEYVIFHSHATLKQAHRGNDAKGFNIKDTWKITNGKLTEHWDAIQPLAFGMRLLTLLTGGALRNNNGVF